MNIRTIPLVICLAVLLGCAKPEVNDYAYYTSLIKGAQIKEHDGQKIYIKQFEDGYTITSTKESNDTLVVKVTSWNKNAILEKTDIFALQLSQLQQK